MIKVTKDMKALEIFNNVCDETIEIILEQGEIRKYSKDTIVFYDKEEVTDIYIVISGTVSLYKLNENGQKKVKIIKVLPNESARIAAESSLLVMDIVVQFEDGSIAYVEVHIIGYLFPGERSACYSADMLLRQYKRVRRELGKKFHYRDIKKVYTIVLFEKSNSVFKSFSKDIYIHRFQQQSDSGIELNLLQEYTFICLDIFDDIIHNEGRNAGDESGERIAESRDGS